MVASQNSDSEWTVKSMFIIHHIVDYREHANLQRIFTMQNAHMRSIFSFSPCALAAVVHKCGRLGGPAILKEDGFVFVE